MWKERTTVDNLKIWGFLVHSALLVVHNHFVKIFGHENCANYQMRVLHTGKI